MSNQVYVFFDHANINTMVQRASAKDLKFPDKIYDPCAKVIPKNIFDYLQKYMKDHIENPEITMYCYTSDKSLNDHDNISGRNIVPRVFNRSGFTGKEKRVDTHMVADAVEKVCGQGKERWDKKTGIISLWTGDVDVLSPVIEKAEKNGWKVDVWSFEASKSAFMEKHPDCTSRTKPLDGIYKEFTERTKGWKSPAADALPPANSSFKLRFVLNSEDLKIAKEHWKDIVDKLTERLKLPLQAWHKWDEAVLYLVLCVGDRNVGTCMRTIWNQKSVLEEFMRNYFSISHKIQANCHVQIDGEYPQLEQFERGTQNGFRGQGRGRGGLARGRGGRPNPAAPVNE